ncbi:hypothetical protein A3K72_01615 [Candidatus Woesearchaeota archaeon RBG_13_36_6]|nr:MAG: hypothetical protein A3K72_01615 [Candidatus Woesearchaeota archaeon RBG_13_36_6]
MPEEEKLTKSEKIGLAFALIVLGFILMLCFVKFPVDEISVCGVLESRTEPTLEKSSGNNKVTTLNSGESIYYLKIDGKFDYSLNRLGSNVCITGNLEHLKSFDGKNEYLILIVEEIT